MPQKSPQTLVMERFCDILERETDVRPRLDEGAERDRQRGWAGNILKICDDDLDLAYRILERWAMADAGKPITERNVYTHPTLANVVYHARQIVYQFEVEKLQPQGQTFKGLEMGQAHGTFKESRDE